jgi:glutamate synthase (NADPH/NADH) large chain
VQAYVYDKENSFREYLNHDLAIAVRVEVAHWQNQLKILIEEHAKETTSPWANSLLYNWDKVLADFWQIVPKEMLGRLKAPISVNSDISLAM